MKKPVFVTPYTFDHTKVKKERNDGKLVTDQSENVSLRDVLERSARGIGLTGQSSVYYEEDVETPDFSFMEKFDVYSLAQDMELKAAQNERDLKRLNEQKRRDKAKADIEAAKAELQKEAAEAANKAD